MENKTEDRKIRYNKICVHKNISTEFLPNKLQCNYNEIIVQLLGQKGRKRYCLLWRKKANPPLP